MAKSTSSSGLRRFFLFFLLLFVPLAVLYASGSKLNPNKDSETLGVGTQEYPNTSCKNGLVEKFWVGANCGQHNFRYVEYVCKNGKYIKEGGTSSCKPITLWYEYARSKCSSYCAEKTPTPSLKPTKTPSPTPIITKTPTKTTTPTPTITPTPTPQSAQ